MSGAKPDHAGVSSRAKSRIITFCSLLAAVAMTAAVFIYHEFTSLREAKLSELTATADLKSMQIGTWYAERLSDARMLSQSAVLRSQAVSVLENRGDPRARQELLGWMEAVRLEGGYLFIALYGADGSARCATPGGALPANLATSVDFQEVVHSGEPCQNLRRERGNGTREVYFDVLLPIGVQDKGGTAVQGVWLLRIDPRSSLFRLVQRWSTPSKSAETLLVRQDGGDVLFLNELPHYPQSAAVLRRSMDLYPSLAATQAVKGREGVVENQDYRDVPTLAVARRVAGTPWSIVVKVDAEEVYAPLKRTASITAALLCVSLLAAAAGMVLNERRRV